MVTKKILRRVGMYLSFAMILEKKLLSYCTYVKQFVINKKKFRNRFVMKWSDRLPCLNDKFLKTTFDKHYVYHTAWAARKLKEISPKAHVDLSSYTYFSTIVSAFIPVKFYDFRPVKIKLESFTCEHADITALHFNDNSVYSLSCMHVVEHIGLGRYGDPIDPDADLKAISEIKRVIKQGGHLIFVVPVGDPRIIFNAHRIYSYDQIIMYFDGFKLKEFSLIPDNSDVGIILNANKLESNRQSYGCGCFYFEKNYS